MLFRVTGIVILTLLTQAAAAAELTATTADGRKVLLRDNGTWEFASKAASDDEASAALTLENQVDLARGCRLGLRLQNDLPAQIRSLVLRFAAYKGPQVAFETVSRGYSYIKPTASQYQEVTFRGIRCDEIDSVAVSAARNCHVGELTKYSASASRCLELVDVRPSDILPIAKQPAD
ncbi:MAG: hypothetical protein QNJ91_00280 [Gammaproteobacteria bacterium]|nr:hypothetical protein [Gammaproteobacteria bacterium]